MQIVLHLVCESKLSNLRLLLARFELVGSGEPALQRAPTFDQYCRAAEPLAVRRLGLPFA